MEFVLLGWPEDGPTLRLDWRAFSYAGKFVMSNTGKAVARDDGAVVAAVSFNADRTDPDAAWLRYLTVREDRRGDGVGARLAAFATERLHDRGFDRVRIAVNNPFAFHALHKAGFGATGEITGLAERVLVHPSPENRSDRYRAGMAAYRERETLAPAEREFVDDRLDADPPATVETPKGEN